MENFKDLEEKGKRLEALINLSEAIRDKEFCLPIRYNDFLYLAATKPQAAFRDIFQLFHDMVHNYIPDGEDEYPETSHSIGFFSYDTSNLFINDCDIPFFADRLFANRFMNLVNGFRSGIQNNRIYLFEGPPGSGKSTFLNNLLKKLEDYTNTPAGTMYKTRWVLDVEKIRRVQHIETKIIKIAQDSGSEDFIRQVPGAMRRNYYSKTIEFSCPNHDHPILHIPVDFRKQFLEELITDKEFKEQLFNSEEYRWVLKDIPCSTCSSLYSLLMDALTDPIEVYDMIQARLSRFNRQFGEGISIFNPGDPIYDQPIINFPLQEAINDLFNNDDIKIAHSYLARTNNGVYALMDIKENNVHRLMSLHGIISDGVHKVELLEERIKSLFFGLINPEDRRHYEDVKSFQDRITTVYVPYILDYNTEVAIYKNKFGKKIDDEFLHRVLENFAKIVISTRLDYDSPAIMEWLDQADRYTKYIDRNLFLLKMEIYAGRIPSFLSEEDVKRFTFERRKKIIAASETEGRKGFSGRKSINIFSTFYTKYAKQDKLITMDMVVDFFNQKEFEREIPNGFVDSLVGLYDFNVLQEVKEAVYYYNESQISRDIQNYLFAINFEPIETKKCIYTGDTILIDEEYFKNIEAIFLGTTSTWAQRKSFRKEIHHEYVTKTLAQDINIKNMNITGTDQFKSLFEKYTRNLKENSMAPYVDNDNFRRAVLDYKTPAFNSFDDRIKKDVLHLINNLMNKYKYSLEGARQVTIYVLDKKISRKY